MAKDNKMSDKTAAKPAATTTQATPAQHPADGELRFQHLIRNMVVARDDARRDREQS